MKTRITYAIGLLLCGIVLLGVGLALIAWGGEEQQVGGYLLMGLGAGVIGGNAGVLLSWHRAQKDPDYARRQAIGEKDERNQLLLWRSKAWAFDGMIYVFGALMLLFVLFGVETWAVLTLVGAYLLIIALSIIAMGKYQREM